MSVVAIFAEAVVSRVHSFYLILFILYPKIVIADDFSLGPVLPETNGSKGAAKGMKRTWLKAFETPPPQMLSAYGLAKYVTMSDEEVWCDVIQPLQSGAEYMTEYASKDAERRGIGINRWLKSLSGYLQYQRTPEQ